MGIDKGQQFSEFLQRLPLHSGQRYLNFEQKQLNVILPQLHGYYLVQLGLNQIYDLTASAIKQHIYAGQANINALPKEGIVANLQALPFQYESIDVMLLPHTLEFCHSPSQLLGELYNILIPGGKIILFGFNPVSLATVFRFTQREFRWGHLYRSGKIKAWLREAGFSVEIGFPCLSSVYVIIAEKRVVPFTPAKSVVFSKKITIGSGFPEPSANKSL